MNKRFVQLINSLYDAGMLSETVVDCINSQSIICMLDNGMSICARWIDTAECIALEGCIENIESFPSAVQLLYAEVMLYINALSMYGKLFFLHLDVNNNVILSRRVCIDGLDCEKLCEEFSNVVQQCRTVRQMLRIAIAYPDFEKKHAITVL